MLLRLSNLDLQIALLYYPHKCHTFVYCVPLFAKCTSSMSEHRVVLHVLWDSYSDYYRHQLSCFAPDNNLLFAIKEQKTDTRVQSTEIMFRNPFPISSLFFCAAFWIQGLSNRRRTAPLTNHQLKPQVNHNLNTTLRLFLLLLCLFAGSANEG